MVFLHNFQRNRLHFGAHAYDILSLKCTCRALHSTGLDPSGVRSVERYWGVLGAIIGNNYKIFEKKSQHLRSTFIGYTVDAVIKEKKRRVIIHYK